ncbi:hypothetical protein [Granulicella sp. S190]|uniref:hypothetical protein n=1 Tax=Granulicella sp. S190 TaxID=1747226 RepID=UPI00131BB711|nr:hypothetical protein [Granulicella sp. S190]
MDEWPQESRNRLSKTFYIPKRLVDIPGDLIREMVKAKSFKTQVQALAAGFNEKVEPQVKLAELSTAIDQPDAFGEYDEVARHAVFALACVAALQRTPTKEMWQYLWSLARHSVSLENLFPEAVIAAANETVFREQFFIIARNVVKGAVQHRKHRGIQGEKGVGADPREYWQKYPQLSTLWRGDIARSSRTVESDYDNVLSIVAKIDVPEFVNLLELYDYPDPVAHALMWCGAPWRFELWKKLVFAAPTAFEEHAKWNGSLILPLLMAIARDEFQFGLGREPNADQVSEATSSINDLAAEVARTIASRLDAVGCMTRWGNWLVRTGVPAVSLNPLPHPTDATAQGFIESALLDALIVEMPAGSWKPDTAPAAESWEPWCQLAAGALIAFNGKSSMPSTANFLDEWNLNPDEWPTQRGQKLKERAIPFDGDAQRADGYGARLLALPLVETNRADAEWKYFWEGSVTLREIVEFGDPDENDGSVWQGRMNAARLLMLQFSIGLMMLDHLIIPPRPLNYDRRNAIGALLRLLREAVHEMAAIDQFNGKFWTEAVRHLAVRRAKWLSGNAASDDIRVPAETKPTLVDFIQDLAGDTENLVALIYVMHQSGVDDTELAAAFTTAEVDINNEIVLAERLLTISQRAIGLNEAQLSVARELLRCSD